MIDVETVESPGWWLQRGVTKLNDQFERLDDLIGRAKGLGPLPHGADDSVREAYCAFQKKARSNWAGAVVRARKERIRLTGFRTEVDNDADGDQKAHRDAKAAGLFHALPEAIWFALVCDSGPLIIGRPNLNRPPIVTAEDPRQVALFRDPATREVRAAIKAFADIDLGKHYIYVFTIEDGRVMRHVAVKDILRGARVPNIPMSASSWDWDNNMGGAAGVDIGISRVPVVELRTGEGVGVFEEHTDILDRIDHQTLQGLVIGAMQAYKQRALVNLPDEDKDGNVIDYDGMFQAGPGAVWNLPEGVTAIDFAQADMAGILGLSKESLRQFSDLTATPLRSSIQDSANQTAEGASFAREALVFSCEDIVDAFTVDVAAVQASIAEWNGDEERSNPATIEPLWADPARRSLTEMADADSKSQNTLPRKERYVRIWGYTPSEAERLDAEKRAEEQEQLAFGLFQQPSPPLMTQPVIDSGDTEVDGDAG